MGICEPKDNLGNLGVEKPFIWCLLNKWKLGINLEIQQLNIQNLQFESHLLVTNIVIFLDPHSTNGPIKSLQSYCLSVSQFGIFLRNGALIFSDFFEGCQIIEISKNDRALFPEKFIFAQIRTKSSHNDPKVELFRFF